MSKDLYDACVMGNIPTIASLLKQEQNPIKINYQDPETGDTVLHATIKLAYKTQQYGLALQILELLLNEYRFSAVDLPLVCNKKNENALALAFDKSSSYSLFAERLFEYMKKHGDINAMFRTHGSKLLRRAVEEKNHDLLAFYVYKMRVDFIDDLSTSPLKLAFDRNDKKAIEILTRDAYQAHEIIHHYFTATMVDLKEQLSGRDALFALENIKLRLQHYNQYVLTFPDMSLVPAPITQNIVKTAPAGKVSTRYRDHIAYLYNIEANDLQPQIREFSPSTTTLLKNKQDLLIRFTDLALYYALDYFGEKTAAAKNPSELEKITEQWDHFSRYFLVPRDNNDIPSGINDDALIHFPEGYKRLINNLKAFYFQQALGDFPLRVVLKNSFDNPGAFFNRVHFQDAVRLTINQAPLAIRPTFDEEEQELGRPLESSPVKKTLLLDFLRKKEATPQQEEHLSSLLRRKSKLW